MQEFTTFVGCKIVFQIITLSNKLKMNCNNNK